MDNTYLRRALCIIFDNSFCQLLILCLFVIWKVYTRIPQVFILERKSCSLCAVPLHLLILLCEAESSKSLSLPLEVFFRIIFKIRAGFLEEKKNLLYVDQNMNIFVVPDSKSFLCMYHIFKSISQEQNRLYKYVVYWVHLKYGF